MAIHEAQKQSNEILNKKILSFRDALCEAFVWEESELGFEFWYSIYDNNTNK